MINVTRPYLPPKEAYDKLVDSIWQRNWLTNNGPLVNELELRLKEYLDLKHLLYVTNGTIALQLAIKALDLTGEIITTPFSYVATTSSIVWESCSPVFVDIDPETFNINPSKIEEAITSSTSAILATHVFGNPCAVEAIDRIAKKYNLKVIYDNAHGFGVTYMGKSLFEYGDVSTASFHATKIFHTVEGGAVVSQSAEVLKVLSFMRNFGHNGPDKFEMLGINGKNSEFHAAMGLAILPQFRLILERRAELVSYYKVALRNLNVQYQRIETGSNYNHAYFPIIFQSEELLNKSIHSLNDHWIYPRRYFFPSLSLLPYVKQSHETPVANDISKRIVCLPLYHELSFEEIDLIARVLLRVQNN